MFDNSRNRKLIQVTNTKLFKDCQKFSFSGNGQYLAIGSKDGTKISIVELIEDSKRSLHEVILIAVCKRGFWSCNLKTIQFSPDNNFVVVTSDNGSLQLFHVGLARLAKNNLKTVHKNHIKNCLEVETEKILEECTLESKKQ